MRLTVLCLALVPTLAWSGETPPPAVADQDAAEKCWLEMMRVLPPGTTLAELRAQCAAVTGQPIAQTAPEPVPAPVAETAATSEERNVHVNERLAGEWQAYDNPFALALYRPNYFIYGYQFSEPNTAPFQSTLTAGNAKFQNIEAKFQISLKFPLALNLIGDNGDLIVGYTNRSFWQMFNHSLSSPFRETDHEPEAWFRWRTDYDLWGGKVRVFNAGFDHQSNGQSGTLSRSWNRLYLESLYERGRLALNLRLWHRLNEAPGSDDNPDITNYMGHFELTGIYHTGQSEFSVMLRHVPGTGHGAVQADWSYPLYKNLRAYLQWFDGYGESLIDYNHRTRSIGLGVQLGEWL